jgi:hypothetical protein
VKRHTISGIVFFQLFLASGASAQQQVAPYKLPGHSVAPESSTAIYERLSDIYGGDITFTSARSAAGDTASGVVIHRRADSIAIDVTPCQRQKTIVTFAAPYRESPVSDEKCGDKTYPRVQVIQTGTR